MDKMDAEHRERRMSRIKELLENGTMILAMILIAAAILYTVGIFPSPWVLWLILGAGAVMNILIMIIGIMSELWIAAAAAFFVALGATGGLYYFM